MNEHTQRITQRIFDVVKDYLDEKIDERQFLNIVEGNIDVIEERDIKEKLEKFLVDINDSIYLFDVQEGRHYLSTQFYKIRSELI